MPTKQTLPPAVDTNADSTPRVQGLNYRKARAGIYITTGMVLYKALRKAGYAPSTARAPKRNGLSVEQCLAEASKLDESADPRTLLAEARRMLQRKLATLDPARESVTAVTRLVDVAERHYGGHEQPVQPGGARTLAERVVEMRVLIDELDRRGILNTSSAIDVTHRSVSPADGE